jgi:hypothetical protein
VDSSPLRFSRLAPALVAALATAFTLRPVDDADVWFHLAAGRLMWTTWRWPATNTFAYTTPEHPWVDVHWVFQLLLFGCQSVAGANGCIALAVLLVLVTTGVLYATARRHAPPMLVAFLLGWALLVASPRFVPRPELLAFALMAAFLWLLDDYPRTGAAIWWLVPLQALWMNAHGTTPLGVPLVGCWWLGATLGFLPLPEGWRAASGCTAAEWRRLTAVLALVVAVCFVTPWGLAGALLPVELLSAFTGASALSGRIGEFQPPFQSGYGMPLVWAWAALVALAAVSFVVNARHLHLGRLLAVVVFGALAARAVRSLAPFVWVAVPVIAANLGGAWRASRTEGRSVRRRGAEAGQGGGRASWLAAGAVTAVFAALLWSVVTNRLAHALDADHEFGVGVSRLGPPIDAVRFADEVGVTGRPFNCFANGGYLMWARYPAGRVFVDGRMQAYPDDFFRAYFGVLDEPGDWPRVVAAYAPDYALLYHVWGNRYPLVRYLASGHDWTLVYYDETSSLYVPTDEAHRAMRERAERGFATLKARRRSDAPSDSSLARALGVVPVTEIRRQTAYGNFLLNVGRPAEAVPAYERAVALDPDVALTRFFLGRAYWFAGRRDRAVAAWQETLRRAPSFALARSALAEAATVGAVP